MPEFHLNTCELHTSYSPQILYGKTAVPHLEADDTQDVIRNNSDQSQYRLRRLISDEYNPTTFALHGTIFQFQDASSSGSEADCLVISDTIIADLLFDIDLEHLPSGARLSNMIGSFIEEDKSECNDTSQSDSIVLPQRLNRGSDLCAVVSNLNSVHSMRRLEDVQSIELELTGSYKILEGKTVHIFTIKGQDIRRPKLKRFSVFVAQIRD